MTYRGEIERDENGRWIAHVRDLPGCHTHGRSLREVKRRLLQALSLWIDDGDQPELDFHVVLPRAVRANLDRANAARSRADAARREAAKQAQAAAEKLVRDAHLSLRDAAELLGLSHQRVQQLASSDLPRILTRGGYEAGPKQVADLEPPPFDPDSRVIGDMERRRGPSRKRRRTESTPAEERD